MTVGDNNLRVRQAMPMPGATVVLVSDARRPQGSQGPGAFTLADSRPAERAQLDRAIDEQRRADDDSGPLTRLDDRCSKHF